MNMLSYDQSLSFRISFADDIRVDNTFAMVGGGARSGLAAGAIAAPLALGPVCWPWGACCWPLLDIAALVRGKARKDCALGTEELGEREEAASLGARKRAGGTDALGV